MKSTIGITSHLSEWLLSKRQALTSVVKNKKEYLYIVGRNVNSWGHYEGSSKKNNNRTTIWEVRCWCTWLRAHFNMPKDLGSRPSHSSHLQGKTSQVLKQDFRRLSLLLYPLSNQIK